MTLKVVIASDSFKGCLSSKQVALAMERGIKKVDSSIEVKKYIVGDGGEGTMEAFVSACQGEYVPVSVHDAYRKPLNTYYGLIENGNCAVIEVGNIIGLNMTPKEKRAPLYASSYGVGEVLMKAKKKGCKKIILALGGSCTNDGGMGLLEAIGVRFLDENGKYLRSMACNLDKIVRIDTTKMADFSQIECIAACDVKNHLLGEAGATYIFGRQKGLYPNQIKKIEKSMQHYAQKMKDIGYDLNTCVGGGAAGGIGAVFIRVLKAQMKPGIELLFSYNNIEEDIKDCDVVFTGEGQTDLQTMYGKVPVGVLALANKYNKPCICISGALGVEYKKLYELGFVGIYSIADRAMSFAKALEQANEKLEEGTFSIMKTIHYFIKQEES